jgi:hypothetical protein
MIGFNSCRNLSKSPTFNSLKYVATPQEYHLLEKRRYERTSFRRNRHRTPTTWDAD